MRIRRFALGMMLLTTPAAAAEPSAEDLRTAYEAAATQRNRAQDDAVELVVAMKRNAASYEARLSTLIEWLAAAQAKQAK